MKINRVLLIVGPAYTFKDVRDVNPLPPMGLGYLASVVEKMGIEVKILDCLIRGWNNEEEVDDLLIRVGLSDNDIAEYVSKYNPDLVGINCQFSRQYKIYHNLFSLIKKTKPECITVSGGAHVTACPDEVLSDPNCDFILLGEAEDSFKDFITAIMNDDDPGRVGGLGWKSNGKMVINEKRSWIMDLDSIEFPAYHLMDLDRYFGLYASHGMRHKERFAPIITSRGCPAKCTFCSAYKVWGRPYRMRSVDNVIEEMKLLKHKYGVEELMFEDDNVTANPKRAKELFSRMIEENLNFVWDTPNGVGIWSLTEEIIDLIKESGCVNLNFPVESGSQRVLSKVIKKPLNLNKVKKLISHCQKIKLNYSMFFVLGMPGETIEDMWTSFRFAADCGCYNPHISIATPYPGTELFEKCKENGYFSREFSLDDLFITSFLISTPEWDEKALKRTYSKGQIYLKYRELLSDPWKIPKWIARQIRDPSKMYRFFKIARA